jgi:ribosomal protein S18 acetylase RimI-like enzyme
MADCSRHSLTANRSMNKPDEPKVALLFPGQDREAAAMLGRAFVDDPLISAIVGDAPASDRIRRMTGLFSVILGTHRRDGQPVVGVIEEGRVAGAAIIEAAHPAGTIATAVAGLPFMPAMLKAVGPQGVRRALTALDKVVRNRPPEPHIYLYVLGVEPAMQGRHCGVAMLNYLREQAMLRPDLIGVYLETATAANVAYYTKAGYETVGEIAPLGVRVWRMLHRRAP